MTAAMDNKHDPKCKAVNNTYLLNIQFDRSRTIRIGKLGTYRFRKGYYTYVGSAKKNLCQRITRHFRKKKKTHWHIDYLLRHARINRIYSCNLSEEEAADTLAKIMDISVPRFGASDKKSASHLFYGKLQEDTPTMALRRIR